MTEFRMINRQAVILLPTEECVAWINSACQDDSPVTLAETQEEPTVYLILADEAESYIRRHFREMFEQELNSWYTDPAMWPKDLSFRNFKKFFQIQVSSVVLDMGKGMIVKEDEN